jgi:hypothetical protein
VYGLRRGLAAATLASGQALQQERIRACGFCVAPGAGEVAIVKSGESGRCRFDGVISCGSVWECPVCSRNIKQRRAQEVKVALDVHGGRKAVLLSLTVRHGWGDDLRKMRSGLADAWRGLTRGAPWRKFSDKVGLRGSIRAAEVTHGENGFHPHLHVLLLLHDEPPAGEMICSGGIKGDAACDYCATPEADRPKGGRCELGQEWVPAWRGWLIKRWKTMVERYLDPFVLCPKCGTEHTEDEHRNLRPVTPPGLKLLLARGCADGDEVADEQLAVNVDAVADAAKRLAVCAGAKFGRAQSTIVRKQARDSKRRIAQAYADGDEAAGKLLRIKGRNHARRCECDRILEPWIISTDGECEPGPDLSPDRGRHVPSDEVGISLRHAPCAEYISKLGLEVSDPGTKLGKDGHRTPFQIATDALTKVYDAERGEWCATASAYRDRATWRAFCDGMRGARQLTWTLGLKAALGIRERTDLELSPDEEPTATDIIMCRIPAETWKKIRVVRVLGTPADFYLLVRVEQEGAGVLQDALAEIEDARQYAAARSNNNDTERIATTEPG